MARLWQTGFELNTTTEMQAQSGSGIGIVSTDKRSGTYSLQVSGLSSGTPGLQRHTWIGSTQNGPVFLRVYFKYTTLPTADNRIITLNRATAVAAGDMLFIQITSTGTLKLNSDAGVIGSPSAALNAGQWYRIELKYDKSPGAGASVGTALIDGVSFATSSTLTYGFGVAMIMLGGNLNSEAQTTGVWYFDDLALNDSNGSFQTSYPGAGRIVHLHPNAAGDSASWTRGGTDTGNNWQQVSEVTPNTTSYNQTVTLNAEDLYGIDAPSFGSVRTINTVVVGGTFANDIADNTTSFKFEIEKTASGTKTQSATIKPNSTTVTLNNSIGNFDQFPIITYQDPDAANWTVDTLSSMQAGVLLTVAGTNKIRLHCLFVSVDVDYLEGSFLPQQIM